MSIFETAIGIVAPPLCAGCGSEGSSICLLCLESEILPFGEKCWSCNRLSPVSKTCQACRAMGSPNHVWVCTDYEGLAADVVRKYKFRHQRQASKELASIMADVFLSQNSDESISNKRYLVVAIPTASTRVRQRSFDHTSLLATDICKQLKLTKRSLLGRLGQTKQVGTTRKDRSAQAVKSYYVKRPDLVKGRNILLIDDVITTGATLSAAAAVLRKAGARSVDGLVFAKRL